MSTLQDLRNDLKATLAPLAGANIYTFVPEAPEAPAAIVTPVDPYLDSTDQPFGSFLVRYRITLVAAVATNEVVTESLDNMIEETVVALANGGYHFIAVGEPYVFQTNDNLHLAADLTVSISTSL